MKLINVLSEKFVKTLNDPPYYRNLKTFDKEHWFEGVWRTINQSYRRIPGGMGDLKNDDNKKKLKNDIFSLIEGFPNDNLMVDEWYQKSIKSLKNKYEKLTIGTSQKLINMMIKYILTSYYSGGHTDEQLSINLRKNINLIHIPIDEYVIRNYGKEFKDSKDFIQNNKLGFGNNKSPWSYLELYSDYEKFQIKIREKRKVLFYNSPLELEMDILWKK